MSQDAWGLARRGESTKLRALLGSGRVRLAEEPAAQRAGRKLQTYSAANRTRWVSLEREYAWHDRRMTWGHVLSLNPVEVCGLRIRASVSCLQRFPNPCQTSFCSQV
jgi:hypothetical protein